MGTIVHKALQILGDKKLCMDRGNKSFTDDELGKFTLTATNKLLKHLEKIAEWTTDKKGNMVRVKPPSRVNLPII